MADTESLERLRGSSEGEQAQRTIWVANSTYNFYRKSLEELSVGDPVEATLASVKGKPLKITVGLGIWHQYYKLLKFSPSGNRVLLSKYTLPLVAKLYILFEDEVLGIPMFLTYSHHNNIEILSHEHNSPGWTV
jgi:hypothetical protein